MQWVVKAHISSASRKSVCLSADRSLKYQLILKSKPPQGTLVIRYLALRGPYGDMKVKPAIHEAEFNAENMEGQLHNLPLIDSIECNKQLSAKTINMRVILFQVQK